MERAILFQLPPEELFELIKKAVHEVIAEQAIIPISNSPPLSGMDILTSKEVCSLLRISASSLIKYRRAGLLKGKLIGGKYHYLKSEVEKSIKEIKKR